MEPERKPTEQPSLTPEQRGRVTRRAAVKPLNVLTLIAGLGISATTGSLWLLLATLAVYATLVFLASRDPIFIERTVRGRLPGGTRSGAPPRDMSPERRARWLPRGETRERVEAALVTYRKVLRAVEESDDVTLRVLEGVVPKLHETADHLVDVASNRERAAQTLAEFESHRGTDHQRESSLRDLEAHVRRADEEIKSISDRLLTLRSQVVRASMDSAGAREQAESINASLDGMNFRLEALNETLDRDPG